MRMLMIAAGLAAGAAQAEIHETPAGRLEVTQVVGGLSHPWALAFLPDGRMLVTERPGRLRLLGDDGTAMPVSGVPEVFDSGQGGLFDVDPAPDFARTGTVFLSYAEPRGGGAGTAVARARLDGLTLRDVEVIFRMNRPGPGGRHFGGRIVIAPDGDLFLTTGDRGDGPRAQDLSDHAGKVLRINPDGAPAPGNPLANRADALPEIWSYGHRNPQGAGLDAQGRLWTVEHGARGGDEINRPQAGANHGWPEVSHGTHYSGAPFPAAERADVAGPEFWWDPSIAPSGLVVYDGAMFPDWRGRVIVGALKHRLIAIVDVATGVETRILEGAYGRVRHVAVGPDGALWFVTDEDPGGVFRVTPAR